MERVVTLERHGATWRIHDPGGRVGAHLAQGRPYEPQLLDEIHARGFTGTALDVGAHVGNHTLYMAAVCGLAVVAFEPDATSFSALRSNVDLNPALRPYIACMRAAAGPHAGRARVGRGMRVHYYDHGDVYVVRIDDVCAATTDVSVVKVDVEGWEHLALAGATELLARCRPVVYAETHTRTAGRKTAAVLEPLGYTATGRIVMGSTMERWEPSS
jgi:FkbM family methyltransferase